MIAPVQMAAPLPVIGLIGRQRKKIGVDQSEKGKPQYPYPGQDKIVLVIFYRHGTTENEVKTQIWIAISVYALLAVTIFLTYAYQKEHSYRLPRIRFLSLMPSIAPSDAIAPSMCCDPAVQYRD
ncbi:MAG: hypothetical protein ACD_75C01695G0001 [uncultured bacterium]|nr:MAG: hypothetical protein ACD_75C01695G0001 [uncultured bacterium]